jgi:hypothetical protein
MSSAGGPRGPSASSGNSTCNLIDGKSHTLHSPLAWPAISEAQRVEWSGRELNPRPLHCENCLNEGVLCVFSVVSEIACSPLIFAGRCNSRRHLRKFCGYSITKMEDSVLRPDHHTWRRTDADAMRLPGDPRSLGGMSPSREAARKARMASARRLVDVAAAKVPGLIAIAGRPDAATSRSYRVNEIMTF